MTGSWFDPDVLPGLRYWIAVLLVISLPGAMAYWFVIHPFAAFWRRLGARRALGLVMTMLALSMVGLFVIRDALLLRDLGFNVLTFSLGVVLYASTILLQFKVSQKLSRKTLVGVPEVSGDDPGRLITDGLYARTRNPRYLVVALAGSSMALMTNYAGVWLQVVLLLPVLYVVVLMEERELRERFGQPYLEYCATVPRFLPLLRNRKTAQ